MITALFYFPPGLSDECIKDICLQFNVIATKIDVKGRQWCLETEEPGNFFNLGLNFQKKVEEFYK